MRPPDAGQDAGPCCLLLDLSEEEAAELAGLPAALPVDPGDLESHALGCPGGVDLVVIGSRATSPVALVQRAHRAVHDAGVVVLVPADAADRVRRQIAYAPGVPLDVLLLGPEDGSEDGLEARVMQLRGEVATRRRHEALLAAVSARAEAAAPAPQQAVVVLGALLEHAPLGVVVCDHGGRVLGWNRRAETLLPLRAAAAHTTVEDLLPGAGALVRSTVPVEAPRPDAASGDGGDPPSLGLRAGGVEVEVSAVASQLDDGRAVALLLLLDVTDRREAERGRDRLAGHVALLARVSESLTSTLEETEALDRLAEALVPELADWVALQLADESGRLAVVTMRHRDPTLAPVLAEARERQAFAASEGTPNRGALQNNRSLLFTGLAEADLADYVDDARLRALFTRLGVSSALAVPLPGRDRVLGSMVLVNAPGSRELSAADVTVATEVGRRAGIAVDNARLYARQRQLATELQRSLLTAPPQPDHGHIVVRYVAAAQEAQVGGDWYDAFLQAGGATVLVIGDVVGHDTRAAAAMSQVRGVLRGIGFTTDADPAEILTRVDAAIQGLLIGTTATAIVARIEQTAEDLAQGVTRLAWSNAGHPPPLVVHPEGRVAVLDRLEPGSSPDDTDLLLGIDPTTPRRTGQAFLRPGSTVLLFTDGLVERRGQSLDEGVAALAAVLSECRGRTLGELCDTVLSRLLPEEPEDDVALVAVRLHSQDEPRPGEAGPNRVPSPLA